MARRKKSRGAVQPESAPAPFHSPFRTLKTLVSRKTAAPRRAVRTARRTPVSGDGTAAPQSDHEFFRDAMEDVVPLGGDDPGRIDLPAPAGAVMRAPVSEEAETLAALGDLVSGNGPIDVSDTDEYIEGAVVGLDPRIVRRMRRGDFSYQAHLDLHHHTAEEARIAVEHFLSAAYRKGQRCVLIIHGRGRNSKDQIPVLKERMKVWLGRSGLARYVLAFTTARPCDGGAGALYVLLRRKRRRRAAFVITNGAKR